MVHCGNGEPMTNTMMDFYFIFVLILQQENKMTIAFPHWIYFGFSGLIRAKIKIKKKKEMNWMKIQRNQKKTSFT